MISKLEIFTFNCTHQSSLTLHKVACFQAKFLLKVLYSHSRWIFGGIDLKLGAVVVFTFLVLSNHLMQYIFNKRHKNKNGKPKVEKLKSTIVI